MLGTGNSSDYINGELVHFITSSWVGRHTTVGPHMRGILSSVVSHCRTSLRMLCVAVFETE